MSTQPSKPENSPEQNEVLDSFREATIKALKEGADPIDLNSIIREEAAKRSTEEETATSERIKTELLGYINNKKVLISTTRAMGYFRAKYNTQIDMWKKARPGTFVYEEHSVFGYPILYFKGSNGQIYEVRFDEEPIINGKTTDFHTVIKYLVQNTPLKNEPFGNGGNQMLGLANQLNRYHATQSHKKTKDIAEKTRVETLKSSGL